VLLIINNKRGDHRISTIYLVSETTRARAYTHTHTHTHTHITLLLHRDCCHRDGKHKLNSSANLLLSFYTHMYSMYIAYDTPTMWTYTCIMHIDTVGHLACVFVFNKVLYILQELHGGHDACASVMCTASARTHCRGTVMCIDFTTAIIASQNCDATVRVYTW
jgi:hypothetical protein